MIETKCALFDRNEKLLKSHIVPKFFYKHIKRDAGNHPFYSVEGGHQDGYKKALLCQEAETLLSKFEKYFSHNIFQPIVYNNEAELRYDSNLLRFVTSLLWKCAIDYKKTVKELKDISETALDFLDPILDNWKQFIKGNTDILTESFYIFPITEKWLDDNGVPDIYHRTFLCDISWNFYMDKNTVTFYAVVPNFLFVAVLFSEDNDCLFSNLPKVTEAGCININIEPTPEFLKMLVYIGKRDIKTIDKVFKNKSRKEKIQKNLDECPKYLTSNVCRIYKKSIANNSLV